MTFSKNIFSNKSTWTYAMPAVALHWLLAVLLTAMPALGWYMMAIEDEPNSGWYFDLHKSVGITIFVLVLLRFLWRISHKPLALPASVSRWQARLASTTQALLYGCMFALPITGLAGAFYSKDGIAFFGLALPTAVPDHDLSEQFFSAHGVIVWVLVGLVALHVAGGLKHLFIDRDGVFTRMWPKAR